MSISEQLKTATENVPKVYSAGREKGYSSGYSDGEQAEYDKFWDALQKNGTQKNYKYVFAGRTWNPDIFKPKYDMKPITVLQMFSEFGSDSGKKTDIADALEKQGVSLDTSSVTNFSNFANGANITRFPTIDSRSATTLSNAFATSVLVTIDELILKDDGTQTFSGTFNNASKLENIVISGVIGSNISFSASTSLTKTSIISIVSALSESLTEPQTITLPSAAMNKYFKSADGTVYTDEWMELIRPKANWHFAFA
ncbi:MAG: hypothetical protein E7397_04030 [Ruminococcaceae bacterium]|nr:hypothetical protein [Oscillospiraceae bacterium]